MQDIDYVAIEILNLSRRTFHALARSGILTIGDLKQFLINKDKYQIHNIGQKSIDEISRALNELSDNSPSLIQVEKTPVQLILREGIKTDHVIQTPIDVLGLSPSIKGKLKRHGIKTIADIRKTSDSVLLDIDLIGPKKLDEIKRLLNRFIDNTKAINSYNGVERTHASWAEIIQSYLESEKDNYIYVLISRFGFKPRKLEEIASELSVTRERVRQIQNNVSGRLLKYLKGSYAKYSSSNSFLEEIKRIFDTHGNNLSLKSFKELLVTNNLLGQFSETLFRDKLNKIDSFEILICWLNLLTNKRYNTRPLVFPMDIRDLVDATNISIKDRVVLMNVGTKERRKIKRKVIFTGGITVKEATRILSQDERITVLILKSLNLQKVDDEWFTYDRVTDNQDNSKIPLRIAGLKMLAINSTMNLDSFHDGLRRHASRFYESIAPIHVIQYILPALGFDIKNNKVLTQLSTEGVLSKSEQCLSSAIKKNGSIASFLEIAEEFFIQKLSLPAVAAALKRSPIVERVNEGLYKLRGTELSWQDIETAQKRQKRFAQDDEITHGFDGVVRMRFTSNSYAFLTGVVGAWNIRELSGTWKVVYDGIPFGDAKIDESYLWGLAKVFKHMEVKIGERMELAFNTWDRTMSVRKVNNENS